MRFSAAAVIRRFLDSGAVRLTLRVGKPPLAIEPSRRMRRFGDEPVSEEDLDQLVAAVGPGSAALDKDGKDEVRFEFSFGGEKLEGLVFDHHGHRGVYVQRRTNGVPA